MKRTHVSPLQLLLALIAIGAVSFLIWEPTVEGVNAHATRADIYFLDPFLAFAYVGSIPFFVALYQAFRLLGRTGGQNPQARLKSLRTIKYCAILMVCFVAIGEIWILSMPSDDHAGGVFMGVLVTLVALGMVAAAIKFERRLQ